MGGTYRPIVATVSYIWPNFHQKQYENFKLKWNTRYVFTDLDSAASNTYTC